MTYECIYCHLLIPTEAGMPNVPICPDIRDDVQILTLVHFDTNVPSTCISKLDKVYIYKLIFMQIGQNFSKISLYLGLNTCIC